MVVLSELKTHLLAWVSSILEHLGVIATGGIVVLLIQMAERKWPQVFNWQTSRRVFLAFLLFAIFQSWESEYLSRSGRERDLIRAHTENDGLKSNLALQTQTIGGVCATKDAVNQTLQQQNRDQQSTINGCLSQAMKLLTPQPRTVTPVPFDSNNDNVARRVDRWLVFINQTVTPVTLIMNCNTFIMEANASIVGMGGMIGGNSRLAGTTWQASISSPAWGPTSPILASITHHGGERIVCSFNPR